MSFDFKEDARFSENLELFLKAMEEEDSDMAKVLRDNIDELALVVRSGEKNLKARSVFNAKIADALDLLLEDEE